MEAQINHWEYIEELIQLNDAEQLFSYLKGLKSDELAGALNHLSKEDQNTLLTMLKPEEAAEVLEEIHQIQAVQILDDLSNVDTAAIISELNSGSQADLLTMMDEEDANAILDEIQGEKAEAIRRLVEYDTNSAGSLMITEFLAFDENQTVRDVVTNLSDHAEKYEKYNIQYIYVTSKGKFDGVLRIRDLLLSRPNVTLSSIVLRGALTIDENDSFEELVIFFDTHDFYGVPVLNQAQELLGVVMRKRVREAQADVQSFEHLETQGIVGGEELRTMPVWLRSKRRLSWLSVNILLNIVAASVIAFYQDTLAAVISLAVFLPIISDMSGCSGNQAVAVSMRELSLGLVKPYELLRVWLQEISVGLINGVALGTLIGLAAWLWKGNVYLGIVVGGALALNTMVAVSLGGVIPLALKKMNIDPALASGPLLTTVTDMFGFFLALSFAAMLLSFL